MLWFLLISVLAGRGAEGARVRAHDLCSVYGYQVLEARFGKETHLLCLKLKEIGSSPLTSARAALLLDPEAEESIDSIQAFPLAEVTMAYGFPVEDPGAGSAEGYIGEDHQFYGVLHLGDRTLHADPYGRDDPRRTFGAFESDYLAAPVRPRRDFSQMEGLVGMHFPFQIEERAHVPGVARARVCDLLLMADREFFERDANASLNHVVRRMVHAVAQADIIFRNADFNEDGVPDNIGFSVKYILVLTSAETNSRVFGDLLNEKTVDGRQYLMRFARLRRLSEVCLGVAFSGHAFHNRTLGLSFTSLGGGMGGAAGGLCDRRAYGRSFNTLALAHATSDDAERVPERIAALTLAHEMGHSFGAHHDDNFPNPECRGYLMGSQSSVVQSSRHFEFSLCSKRLIAATLNSMSYCLTDEDAPYCGNATMLSDPACQACKDCTTLQLCGGVSSLAEWTVMGIVEEGEACDCGMPSRCSSRDPCCTPRAGGALVLDEGTLHKEGCAVAPTAMCHPSQGLCCSGDCKYADLTKSGIDCSTQDTECSCPLMSLSSSSSATSSSCNCGLGGRCLPDGSCHAAECATLGLKECQCRSKGTGGTLGRLRMCGVCCELSSGGARACVGAELAAMEALAMGRDLPYGWPDGAYKGPNVSLRLCTSDICTFASVRAWPVGEPCVTRNAVGFCSLSGVCKPRFMGPRTNVYPDTVHARLMRQLETSSAVRCTVIHLLLIVFIVFIVK